MDTNRRIGTPQAYNEYKMKRFRSENRLNLFTDLKLSRNENYLSFNKPIGNTAFTIPYRDCKFKSKQITFNQKNVAKDDQYMQNIRKIAL